MRVSKKQEKGPVEKNTKPPRKDKTSTIDSFSKTQNMGVLLAEGLSKSLDSEAHKSSSSTKLGKTSVASFQHEPQNSCSSITNGSPKATACLGEVHIV